MAEVVPRILACTSSLKPVEKASAITSAMTPAAIPRIEITEITDTMVCLRFARRYRSAMNASNFIVETNRNYELRITNDELKIGNSSFVTRHSSFVCSGRSNGNRITSRIDCEFVRTMVSRSMPIPSPAVGGIP